VKESSVERDARRTRRRIATTARATDAAPTIDARRRRARRRRATRRDARERREGKESTTAISRREFIRATTTTTTRTRDVRRARDGSGGLNGGESGVGRGVGRPSRRTGGDAEQRIRAAGHRAAAGTVRAARRAAGDAV
jgi:hypothetical protein